MLLILSVLAFLLSRRPSPRALWIGTALLCALIFSVTFFRWYKTGLLEYLHEMITITAAVSLGFTSVSGMTLFLRPRSRVRYVIPAAALAGFVGLIVGYLAGMTLYSVAWAPKG